MRTTILNLPLLASIFMFVYKSVAKIVNIGLRVYFRKIYFYNEEVVNLDKPVLIACNHPTAFIEPLLIGSTLKKPIHYLVRADIFRGGIIKFFTDSFGMVPIYRFVDGYSNLKNNQEIFKMLYKKLSENHIIVVFAEGNTIQEKRLRSIKKGTARMAFGCYEKYGIEDIDIIPTGVNYTYPNRYRKEVMIEFGEPIQMADYMEVYKEHPNRAIMQLTKELQKRMEQVIICIDSREDEELVEQQFVMNRSLLPTNVLPVQKISNDELKSEWNVANTINKMDETAKAQLKTRTQSYFDQLSKHQLTDHSILNGNKRFNIFSTLFLIVGFIPFIIGITPILIAMFFAEELVKAKIKAVPFEAPIRFVTSYGQYLVVWIIALIISLISWNPFYIGFVLAMPFITWFAASYVDVFRGWNADRKWTFANKDIKNELAANRKKVVVKKNIVAA